MNKSHLEIAPGILLDARRAIFLRETGTLAVADLHLGYAWAHRHGGQLLPVSAHEDSLPRLVELIDDYHPSELVLLGDIVHRAVSVDALKAELCATINALNERIQFVLLAGNHDRRLRRLLDECGLSVPLAIEHSAGTHLLTHGDAISRRAAINARGGLVIIGHEHPAITISDRVTTTAKCPCFLVSDEAIVLPAFSRWASGTDVRNYPRMSPWLAGIDFKNAVAIVGEKLLP